MTVESSAPQSIRVAFFLVHYPALLIPLPLPRPLFLYELEPWLRTVKLGVLQIVGFLMQ
ncbi:hypothetical protein BDZ91DRAFT_27312 [Kalaharituber pfeilii]|nr:hypothetical protein BDZ91DRAFT_27312 [Kalaharituber pfeilii]